jgi:alpha/beta superfamily hydrolase
LEGLLEKDAQAGPVRLGVAVCHPHPRYGGTMRDKVVHRIARGARRAGAAVLRFNFRGVGLSAGEYDQGIGEQDDVRAALTFLGEQYPGLPLVAAGFSFGARVSLEASCSDPRVERVIAAGAPAGQGDWRFLERCSRPKHFVHSTHDQFGTREQMEAVFRLSAGPKQLTWIEAQDHFFEGALDQLEEEVFEILAARPSMGKTALALNIAENVAVRENRPVAIFSLEMSKESLLLRLLSADAQIDSHKFRTGHLNREDGGKIPNSLRRLSEAPLWIDDAGAATVMEMGAKLRRLKREKGLALAIVDYLQLVSARGRFGNRNEEVSSITRGLNSLAKELKLPVLGLSQLTRAPEREDRRPQLADLRESGAIEQDADVVIFIHRPNAFKPDELA